MLRIAIIIDSSFYLFASQTFPTLQIEDSDKILPLRREPAMYPGIDAYLLEHGTLEDKLVTMVMGSFLDEIDVCENKTIELIKSNPGNSNPYSNKYEAYLITLACRQGMKNTVQAIIKSNPDSLNCLSSGLTPLDEAIEFNQKEVADYIRSIGATCTLVDTANDVTIQD